MAPDGLKIVTCVAEDVLYTDISTGTEIGRFASVRLSLYFRRRIHVLLY